MKCAQCYGRGWVIPHWEPHSAPKIVECASCEGTGVIRDNLGPASVLQPSPAPTDGIDTWLLVVKDMEERRQLGLKKYGQPVHPDNGRDSLVDAYQEALDLVVYLRNEIEKRERERNATR